MKQIVIENPILNSPYVEPQRHFRFSDEGITNEIFEARRISSYFVPIPLAKKKNPKQLVFDTEWTADRIEENRFINQVRERVALWRKGGYVGITRTTARLLEYWQRSDRERLLFFCQIEAVETAIYVTEVAHRYGDAWIENGLHRANEDANPLLYRIAIKMATGSGKTLVMAMLIAWHALNKLANLQDARFSDAFLIVTPGITIRDRLRVLLPNDPQNYYRQHDLVPPDLLQELGKVKMVITNFHAFLLHERSNAGKLTKEMLNPGMGTSPFTETPDQMVRRACRELGNKKNIIVLNDEAHHCYRRKPENDGEELTGDERKEAERREEEARIWISGLEAVKAKIGIKVVYDLSATPFFLKGSGYPEGTLFPWVVSDFSLIDAIESGIVKVPRVPVADDSMVGEQPTYRDLWLRIREHLPKKGRKTEDISAEPNLPVELEGALQSLYSNYEKHYRQWEIAQVAAAQSTIENKESTIRLTPPVFIVVCNNTNVSKLVFDYVAGWEKSLTPNPSPKKGEGKQTVLVPGKLPLFSNVMDGQWTARPSTILIDSQQLESGEAMSDDFKRIAAREIEEFKAEYRVRFPGRDADDLTDEDLLREVMNTVGKPGRLGELIRCVVSVSMLTEGWDANTVTHILGVRAFGTQLLCEQVVGRGLRRMSYMTNSEGMFDPEYAEVYGVPFSFIPSAGSAVDPTPGPIPTRVRALEERIACEITFPRVVGYRYELPSEQLEAVFTQESHLALSTSELPVKTEMASIIGEAEMHTLYGLKNKREQEIDFRLASLVLEKYFRDYDGNPKPWLFPQLLRIARRWRVECLTCKDNTFPQMLLMTELAHDAADRIYHAIMASTPDLKTLLPILRPYDAIGSTRYVDFDTTRPVYRTDPRKCHISHVVADTGTWEQKMAQALEEMDEVVCYVKNINLGFTIPYTLNGEEHGYIPDFIVKIALTPVPSPAGRGGIVKVALPAAMLERVRELRHEATNAEDYLWGLLRNRQLHGAKFRRQHPMQGFILDFYCHEAKLAIELDGEFHDQPEQARIDKERTQILNELGLRVMRFRNQEVFDAPQAVLEKIANALTPNPLTPALSQREREKLLPSPFGRGVGGEGLILNLLLEVSGEARKDKAAKVATARNLWVPAINNHGDFGRWAFLEISDPWDAQNTIRAFLRGEAVDGVTPFLRYDRGSK